MKFITYLAGLLTLVLATSSLTAGPPRYNGFSKIPTKKHSRVHEDKKPLFSGCSKQAKQKGTSKVSSKRSDRNRKPYHKRMKGH